MKKIIILAGSGELPYYVASELKKRNIDFHTISFANNKVSAKLKKFDPIEINFGKIVTELKNLKKKNFDSIIMSGGLTKPKLNEIKPDINSLKLIPMFAKKIIEGGDNNLLTFCIKRIEDIGLKIINIKEVLPELFLGKGVFSKIVSSFSISLKNSGSTTKNPPLIQPLVVCGFSLNEVTVLFSISNSPKRASGRTAVTVIIFP